MKTRTSIKKDTVYSSLLVFTLFLFVLFTLSSILSLSSTMVLGAPSSTSAPIVLEKNTYVLGETVILDLGKGITYDLTIKLLGNIPKTYKYKQAEGKIAFTPSLPGDYQILLVDELGNPQVLSFNVVSEMDLSTDKPVYSLGEEVNIKVLGRLSTDVIYLLFEGKKLRFIGNDDSDIIYTPTKSGFYQVELVRGSQLKRVGFEVKQKSDISDSEIVDNNTAYNTTHNDTVNTTNNTNNATVNTTHFTHTNSNVTNATNATNIPNVTNGNFNKSINSSFNDSIFNKTNYNNNNYDFDLSKISNLNNLDNLDDLNNLNNLNNFNWVEELSKPNTLEQKNIKDLTEEIMTLDNSGAEWVKGKGGVTSENINYKLFVKQNIDTSLLGDLKKTVNTITSIIGFENEVDVKQKKSKELLILSEDNDLLIRLENATINDNDSLRMKTLSEKKVESEFKLDGVKLESYERAVKNYVIDPSSTNFTNGSLITKAKGNLLYKCASWNYDSNTCDGEWKLINKITPGTFYELKLTPDDPAFVEVGLATINTNKSLYHPGEKGQVLVAVLDNNGFLVSNADLKIVMTTPNNTTVIINSSLFNISEVSKGIYSFNYTFSMEGRYDLSVEAVALGVNTSFSTYVDVKKDYPFDIIRTVPMSFDPWLSSVTSKIKITLLNKSSINKNFTQKTFSVVEEIPMQANVLNTYPQGFKGEFIINNSKYLVWTNITNNTQLYYELEFPKISPELYLLGKTFLLNNFQEEIFTNKTLFNDSLLFVEAKPWFLAADPTTYSNQRFDVTTGNSGHIRDRNCGSTGRRTTLMSSGNNINSGTWNTGSGREYRMFMSFDTSSIPDSATINSATLYVYLTSNGGDAGESVELYSCNFGGSLENADFQNTVLGTDHGVFFTSSSSTGQFHSLALSNIASDISKTGTTQLCLYVNGGCRDDRDLWNTDSSAANVQPYLILDYTTNAAPTHNNPSLVSSLGYNETTEDIYCNNQSTADADSDSVINIYNWYLEGNSLEVLNTPFEGSSNSTWTKDYSGNSNNGVVNGATWNRTGGKVGGAYEFDGANDYIQFQGDDLSTTGQPFTVEFWFKPSSTIDSSIASSIALVEKREGGGANDWLINFDSGDAGRMRVRSYAGNIQSQTATWTAGTWYHIAFVYNGNTNSTIYVDGVADNRNNDYNIGTLTQSTEDIFVGTRYDQSEDFTGSIDELRIYNRALTSDQILSHHNLDYHTIKSSETTVGDNWTCEITPNDAYLNGLTKTSSTLMILANSGVPPNITSFSVNPTTVALGSSFNVTATMNDSDGSVISAWVNINGTDYNMSNPSGDNWNVTINTLGFSSGLLTYTIYAEDDSSKQDTEQGNITVTNTLEVSVNTDKASYYIGDNVNSTTSVTIASNPVNSAGVTNDIIKINSSSETIKRDWWDTSFHYRTRFEITDSSGVNRTNYWISLPITLDSDCSLDAHDNSLRLIDDNENSLNFLAWNITTCSGNSAYIQSLWISFKINLTANQERDFYIYYDNSTGKTKIATEQSPWLIVYVDQGTGSGSFPDSTDIESRYDTALGNLGLSSTGFYDTLSTSRSSSDVPLSSLTPYPYVHYSTGSKYRNSWDSTEAANIYSFVQASGSVLITGPETGFDADEDGWIFNSAWNNLTHVTSGFGDDSNALNADIVANHIVTQYLGPSGSSFQVTDTYPDYYSTIGGPVAVNIYDWDTGNYRAGTANNGLFDSSCGSGASSGVGYCGKTEYYAGSIVDTSGNGISNGADREKFLRGTIDWFLNYRNASISYSKEQEFVARSSGSTNSNGLYSSIFDSSSWTPGLYASFSNSSKTGYQTDYDFTTFTMSVDYSNYPTISNLADTPDPVPLGYIVNITADITDSDNNLDSVLVNINGTNYTMSQYSVSGTTHSYYVEINTTGFALGVLTYTIYANDTDAHDATPSSSTVTVSNSFQVSLSTDKSEYTIGETVTATSQTFLGFQATSGDITLDIIKGITNTPWWNTSWTLRKKFSLTTSDSTSRTNEIVRLNITGLNGNITDCVNQLRLIKGSTSDSKIETPFTVESTDDSNWCYIRFLTNITAGTSTIYYVYYNNTAATNPSYSTVQDSYVSNNDFETTSSWTYYEDETADNGAYSTTTANSPTHSYNIHSGSSATAGNYAEIYQDIALPCSDCQLTISVYNRLESAGTTANAFKGQIIMNTTTISDIGTPGSANSPLDWTKRSGYYTPSSLTERLHLRFYSDVTFTGGSYGRRDVYWDDANIKTRYSPTSSFGSEEQWIARKAGTTNSGTGLLNLLFNSINYSATNYTAVSLAKKITYSDDTDYAVFLMKINTSGYPEINSVLDEPDPVLTGNNLNFTVNVTDTGGIDQAWIIIDSTTRINLSNSSTSSPDLWFYSLSTSGLTEGTHNYFVYANDTDGNQISNGTFTFDVTKTITVVVTGDKPAYTSGDLANFLINATIVGPVSGGTTTNDIIMGSTKLSWWNIAWQRRKPLAVSEPDATTRTDAIVEVNITGLAGNISNCNEVRIVDYGLRSQGTFTASGNLVEAKSFGGDNNDWCLVRFYANLSVSESTTTSNPRFYAYYNNTGVGAQSTTKSFKKIIYYDNGENSTLRSYWTRDPLSTDGATAGWWQWDDPTNYQVGGVDAQPENDVTGGSGIYALFTGPTGDNSGTGYQGDVDGGETSISSKTIDLSEWSKVNISFYRWFYSNDNGGNNDDTCAMKASVNNGSTFSKDIMVLHDDDYGGDTDYYNSWGQVSYQLENILSSSEFNNQFVLLADGDDYGDGDVMECGFDEINMTGLASDVSASSGSTELFVQRTTNTTQSDGTAYFYFDTTGQTQGSYMAISRVSKTPYDDGSDGFPFSISPDAPPQVTLTSPSNGSLTNNPAINFQCSATDDFNLVNITLYNNLSGSWQSNGTQSASGTADSASFLRTLASDGSDDGTYIWNCLAYDNISQSGTAIANYSITLDTSPPSISLIYPRNNYQSDTNAVLFSYRTNDLHNITSCSLIINGSTVSTDNTVTNYEPSYFSRTLSNGAYSWNISCTDTAGNTNTSETRTLIVQNTYKIINGTFYESSWFNCNYAVDSSSVCSITLADNRNSTEHSSLVNPVQPTSTAKVEAASVFMGTNGAFINSGSLINFSGEFFTNPVSQGVVNWQLYKQDTSLTRTLICQDINNPLFSSLQGSCSPASDVYLTPAEQLFLILTFTNDETNNISYTHYWDSTRSSLVDINLTTVGFLDGSITYPVINPVTYSQATIFTLNCTFNCTDGGCPNTNVYAQYDPGTGFENIGFGSSEGIILNGTQSNPVSLGVITNSSSLTASTASFSLIANNTGSYPVRCSATDVAETAYTNNLTVNVGDNSAPVVTLQTPPNDTFVNTDPVSFVFYVDDSSFIDNCTLILNDSLSSYYNDIITTGQNNTIVASLTTGTYNWSVVCYDDGGLSGYGDENRTLYVDTITPNLTISYPINEIVDTSYVLFNWSVVDDWPGNLTCNITIDGSALTYNTYNLTSNNGGVTTYNAGPFSLGQHFYNMTCWDQAKNNNISDNYYFNVTDSAPQVFLINPSNDALSNSSLQTLIYQVNENNALQYCKLFVDGVYAQTNSTSVIIGVDNNFTVSGLSDGLHNWTVLCNDSGGQSDMASPWNLSIDVTPPLISLMSPGDLSMYTVINNVTLSFNVTDAVSNSRGENLTCNLTINNAINESNISLASGSTYNTNKNSLGDDYYYWNVTCKDNATNVNTSNTWLYTINNTPSVSLVSPAINAYEQANINFTYFADDNDNLANCSIYIDGSFNKSNTEITEGANNQFTVNGLTEGVHNWYVVCVDSGAFNNINQTNPRNFTVDLTKPTIVLHDPGNDTIINSSSTTINFTVTDNFMSSINCNITIDGTVNSTEIVNNGTPFNKTIVNLPNGYHYWNVTCWDDAGNTNVSKTWKWFNNVPPSVYLQAPTNMTFNNTGDWSFIYKPVINDIYAESAYFVNCSLYLDGIFNQTNTSPNRDQNNTFYLTSVSQGLHNWSVECYEDSGASGVSNDWYFVEDSTPPSPIITTINNSWFNSATPIINFNITDNLNYDVDYQFFVDSVSDSNAHGTIAVPASSGDTLSSLSEGSHIVLLQSTDQAENSQNSSLINITVDLTNPSVVLNDPPNNNVTANDSVTFNFTVDDNLASTIDCGLYIDGSLNKSYNSQSTPTTIVETIYNVTFGTHTWYVECVDLASNTNVSETRNFSIPAPDFVITAGNITFNNTSPSENEIVLVNATVFNLGSSSAPNVIVRFYQGDPDNGGAQIGVDHTIPLFKQGENYTFSETFTALVGDNNIYVVVDPPYATGGTVGEDNESNNKAYNTVQVGLYNIFYGLTNSNLEIADKVTIPVWEWISSNSSNGKIYVADSDASISFTSLQALGRKVDNSSNFADFATLDSAMSTTNLTDNINTTWTSLGSPKEVTSLDIFGSIINNIPVVNSTNTSSFKTGILWDTNDGGVQYSGTQDIILMTLVNESHVGSRGTYDYEIKIPTTLDQLVGASGTVTFYSEII